MTPQDIWWKTYWAALTGLVASNSLEDSVDYSERVADDTIRRFVDNDGRPYAPDFRDFGGGK